MKIQEFFIWLPVEIDLNISGTENILNCVLNTAFLSTLLRQDVHKYPKALSSKSRLAGLAISRALKLCEAVLAPSSQTTQQLCLFLLSPPLAPSSPLKLS